ncbi:hypothetical protein niasHT_026406 [Heterodera trifolii]|uniref:Laminin N-terminal domain-containing protein n=1 Tax=Heterodera trifolii TaxID=157864 RepID=A0ABD2JBM4_9BILA
MPTIWTCWVSEPTTAFPHNVSLTLSLGKKFEITYVSLHFCGRLADSLAIFKSANRGRTWTPMQFYSTECEKVYQRMKEVPISKENEQVARCTDSHILSPLSDRIAFATLEGRPSAMEFEQSPVLQDWVTATDIRVVFNRLSMDQAELYGLAESDKMAERIRRDNGSVLELSEPDRVRERYFYAMAELAVGGRCKCNGHASRCVIDRMGRYSCDCKHATTGLDCEKCRPFHFDRPWARATADDANACVVWSLFWLISRDQSKTDHSSEQALIANPVFWPSRFELIVAPQIVTCQNTKKHERTNAFAKPWGRPGNWAKAKLRPNQFRLLGQRLRHRPCKTTQPTVPRAYPSSPSGLPRTPLASSKFQRTFPHPPPHLLRPIHRRQIDRHKCVLINAKFQLAFELVQPDDLVEK